MDSRFAPGLGLLLIAACTRTVAPPDDMAVAVPAAELPRAVHATPGRFKGTTVTRRDERMTVDGVTVDASEDALVAALRKKNKASMDTPPDAPATLGLRLSRTTPAMVVKRLVSNATQAGYSRVAIAVEAAGSEAHLDVDTSRVPRLSGGEPEYDLLFRLDGGEDRIVLVWLQGDQVISSLDVPWNGTFEQSPVAARVKDEWKTKGRHRDPSDPRRDLASVSAPDTTDLATLVGAYDTILATTRSFADIPGPAFDLAFGSLPVPKDMGPTFGPTTGFAPSEKFASGPSVRMGEPTVKGSMPFQIIQRIVRQSFGRFRLCYENGLRHDQALAGDIVVHFTIGTDGSTGGIREANSTLKDKAVRQCVTRAFAGLSFPLPPDERPVDVLFPIEFAPRPVP